MNKLWKIFFIAALLLILYGLCGCKQLILHSPETGDTVKYNTFLTDTRVKKITYKKDGSVTVEHFESETDDVNVVTPYGGFGSE